MSDSRLNEPASTRAEGDETARLRDVEEHVWRRRFELIYRFCQWCGIACLTGLISFGPILSTRGRRSQ